MSLVQNSRTNPIQALFGALQYAGSSAAGSDLRRKLLLAVDEVIFMPVKAFGQLPLVTTSARAEARTITVTRNTLNLREWPSAFEGLTVAFLTDLHCSPLTPPAYLSRVVEETNQLQPDLILLGGDYVTDGTEYIRPVAEVLGRLQAPLGVYSVLGNHDHLNAPEMVRSALRHRGIVDVNNSGHWITRGDSRIRIGGVGDLWEDKQDLDRALSGVTDRDAVILLSHNPDYAMELIDPRVKLVLSGHTHGGQILLPGVGPVVTNTNFGLVSGLHDFVTFQLYVSRGLGTVVVPMRYRCPPEVALLTLKNKN
jgi:predicted MPP superfamily phosphohydrolase